MTDPHTRTRKPDAKHTCLPGKYGGDRRQILVPPFSLVIGLIILAQPCMAAMSMIGTTGLVNVPTAHIIPDGKVAFGIGYTDRRYSLYSPEYAQVAYYVTVGYLPFLEVSLRITNFPGKMERGNYGSFKDRMASVKLQVVNEHRRLLPSVLLGIHDMLGVYGTKLETSVHFNTAYIVMSKPIYFPIVGTLHIHVGYASDLMMREAGHHSMLGPFAGLEKKLCGYLTVMGEYDTKKCSIGLRVTPWGDRANIDVVALGLKRVSGGVSIFLNL